MGDCRRGQRSERWRRVVNCVGFRRLPQRARGILVQVLTLIPAKRLYFAGKDFDAEVTTLISTHSNCAHKLKSFPVPSQISGVFCVCCIEAMRILLSWIRDFVPCPVKTLTYFELESFLRADTSIHPNIWTKLVAANRRFHGVHGV
jgi:hypothetical protein